MSSKKFLKVVFALLVFGILSIGGVNYIVDPFQQYRVKTFYPIAFTNQRYQNAGLSKNFEYDSLILGTSMTENFILDEVEKKALEGFEPHEITQLYSYFERIKNNLKK
jgi:hypothetical protein